MFKKTLVIITIPVIALSVSVFAEGGNQGNPQNQSSKNQPNSNSQPFHIVREPDQTDIYAIPLDDDAFEQEEELNQLEHPTQSNKTH